MSSILSHAPDVATFSANIVVGLAAIAAVIVGAMSATKKIKDSVIDALKPDASVALTTTNLLGGQLQDAFGREITGSVEANTFALEEVRQAIKDNTNALVNVRDELREIRHQNDRLAETARRNRDGG